MQERILEAIMFEPILKVKHLLVVGGTGFIGRWVVRGGIERGYRVSVLSRNLPEPIRKIEGVDYLKADISDRKSMLRAFETQQITHVVNLGGDINHSQYRNGGRKVIDTHFNGVLNLVHSLDWKHLECFTQIGSSDEYGNAHAPQLEVQTCSPISNYSFAKLATNQFLQMLHRTEGFPAIMLRLFLVYGPGQDQQRFFPQIISACLNNKPFPTSYGEQLRDFCYVEDIVKGVFLALESKDCYGEIFNLASGLPISIRSMIEHTINLVGSGLPEYGKVQYRVGENMALYANVEKADTLLKWKPTTSLDEGLRKTVEYFRGDS